MQARDPRPILVIGSTGKTGRRVLERLEAQGVPTRAGSRGSVIPFDWHDPATWGPAVAGVRAAYVTFVPDLAVPGAPEAIQRFTDLAREAGVERIVLLSGRGESEARRSEQIVAESGLEWAVVRASWFAQNFSEGFLYDLVMAGTVALPVGDVREPFVDVDDIADVAVASLLAEPSPNRVYEVTGPRLMGFAEAVREVASAIGREVTFVPIPHPAFLDGAAASGVPADYVALLDYLFTEVLDGRNESLATGVQEALGREPRDFREYAADAAAAGAWAVEVAR